MRAVVELRLAMLKLGNGIEGWLECFLYFLLCLKICIVKRRTWVFHDRHKDGKWKSCTFYVWGLEDMVT